MKYPRAQNHDEHWGREAAAMGLGLSTMGIGLVTSTLTRKPEVAICAAVLGLGFALIAWPKGSR